MKHKQRLPKWKRKGKKRKYYELGRIILNEKGMYETAISESAYQEIIKDMEEIQID